MTQVCVWAWLLPLSWSSFYEDEKTKRLVLVGAAAVVMLASSVNGMAADSSAVGSEKIKHVLLLSIDAMHAVDFYNCANGIAGVNGGSPFCPNMAALSQSAINYVGTSSSKPSDSFPGLAAQTVSAPTATAQVAPTILNALGLDPNQLDAVRAEGTAVLPEVAAQLAK
jgi:hypothetical protein